MKRHRKKPVRVPPGKSARARSPRAVPLAGDALLLSRHHSLLSLGLLESALIHRAGNMLMQFMGGVDQIREAHRDEKSIHSALDELTGMIRGHAVQSTGLGLPDLGEILRPQRVDIRKLVGDAVRVVNGMTGVDVQVEWKGPLRKAVVKTDSFLVTLVILEWVMGNAGEWRKNPPLDDLKFKVFLREQAPAGHGGRCFLELCLSRPGQWPAPPRYGRDLASSVMRLVGGYAEDKRTQTLTLDETLYLYFPRE